MASHVLVVIGTVLALALAVDHDAPSTNSLTSTLTGSVTDGIGDTVNLPVIQTAFDVAVFGAADLAAATSPAAVSRHNLSFAPGTLSAPDFCLRDADVDESVDGKRFGGRRRPARIRLFGLRRASSWIHQRAGVTPQWRHSDGCWIGAGHVSVRRSGALHRPAQPARQRRRACGVQGRFDAMGRWPYQNTGPD
jgi:hypothetical protein